MENSKKLKVFQIINTTIFFALLLWNFVSTSPIADVCLTSFFTIVHIAEFKLTHKKKNAIFAFICFLLTIYVVYIYYLK